MTFCTCLRSINNEMKSKWRGRSVNELVQGHEDVGKKETSH